MVLDVKKTYDLIRNDGAIISSTNMVFDKGFWDPAVREDRARQLLRGYKSKIEAIDELHAKNMEHWVIKRKEWEEKLVLRVWDEKLGSFPPYVTSRDQLDDQTVDIPPEYLATPEWRPVPYCASCLEALPVTCKSCQEAQVDPTESTKQNLTATGERTFKQTLESERRTRNQAHGRRSSDDGSDDNIALLISLLQKITADDADCRYD